jgi:dipeptidase D
MSKLNNLTPQPLFNYFEEICQVPRPSKKEEKIRKYLLDFAKKNNLEAKEDEIGNVLIKKPATSGMENTPTVILQTHMDMVCEKNSDKIFDFDNDPIEIFVDENWIKANGTTLGADCGIGIAAQLAVLTSKDIKHGAIECLITVDEETGLTGAFNIQDDFLSGSVLLNLDSEDEGEIFIGCAGGIDTIATFNYKKESIPTNSIAFKISVSGLQGGHSGDDINKNRGNANKILNRFLWNFLHQYDAKLADFNGGNLRNAIAREACGIFTVAQEYKQKLLTEFQQLTTSIKNEYKLTEPKLQIDIQENELPDFVVNKETSGKLINAIYACPHGVLEMSTRMEGMVETSSNLASVKFINDDKIEVTTSQRSEIESRKYYAAETIESVFKLADAQIIHSDGYPGWTPNPESEILKITTDSYKELFGNEPIVRSIHAGLECGLFLEKYPHLDMVSFGPTIRGAHSPEEKLDIASTEKFWKHLIDVLGKICKVSI